MSEQERRARRERLAALRSAGIDPFPARVGPREPIAALRARFEEASAEALAEQPPRAAVCGRVMASRSFGKLLFLDLLEDGVRLQVSVRKQEVSPELFAAAKAIDVADFVRVSGIVWRTKTGELTLDLRELEDADAGERKRAVGRIRRGRHRRRDPFRTNSSAISRVSGELKIPR